MKVKLEALDGKVITERTGKRSVIAHIDRFPIKDDYLMFIYDKEEACESPGVSIEINGAERLGNQFKFFDYKKRPFMVTLLD